MVSRIKKTVKGKITRERKKIIVVGTEGNNKTEISYLRYIEKKQNDYHFIFAAGNDTDPASIVRNTIKKARDEEISQKNGDMAISLFDLDLDKTKEIQLNEAKGLADSKKINIYTSNPCFEIWYIEHFGYTSKPFYNSTEVIRSIKKFIPEYTKNMKDYDYIYPLTRNAITNCIQLEEHHRKSGTASMPEFCNPQTEVHRLVQIILKGDGAY